MKVVRVVTLRRAIKEKITEKSVIQSVSKRALDYFADFINEMADEIINEAMEGSFYKMASIDIKKGIDAYLRKQMIKVPEKEYIIK